MRPVALKAPDLESLENLNAERRMVLESLTILKALKFKKESLLPEP